jgi:hypothetical protein
MWFDVYLKNQGGLSKTALFVPIPGTKLKAQGEIVNGKIAIPD